MTTKHLNKLILESISLCLAFSFLISCTKIEREAKVLTTTLGDITLTSAKVTGEILDVGSGIDDHGHCWSITESPTIADSKTSLGLIAKTGSFISELQNLQPGTTYYVKSYVRSGDNVIYGKMDHFETYGLQDIDDNYYHIVVIGAQTWMKENIKTTKYIDGKSIPMVTDNSVWGNLISGAYCWYNNDEEYFKAMYGALYNWYAVNTNKLCPIGWHLPSDSEWTELINYLGGESVAGGKLKETGDLRWNTPNTAANNQSGFTALPGGYRTNDGGFYYIGSFGYWWSSTEVSSTNAWYRYMFYYFSNVYRNCTNKKLGFSVRCVRD
jgi:uncharacterized protein (TIGR02145 family)